MKTLRRIGIVIATVALLWMPNLALCGQNVCVVCAKFDALKNCQRCSEHFWVTSEDKADAKCARMGFDEAYFFRNVRAAFRWMRPNCSCGEED